MANENVFGVIQTLAASNSDWIARMQELMGALIVRIEHHLDNVDDILSSNKTISELEISDLQAIYKLRLDAYEALTNALSAINKTASDETKIEEKMYKSCYKKYKTILDSLK